jgi:microcompartment protein CcmK/EutM
VWDLGCQNVKYAEKSVSRWDDPGAGSKKMSLVDLTGRKGSRLANDDDDDDDIRAGAGASLRLATTSSARPAIQSATPHPGDAVGSGNLSEEEEAVDAQIVGSSTVGLGGDGASARSDREALEGRMGRMETCVVNAAIMKSRYPHVGGKVLNKPIVVDLDLPVWEEDG